MFLNPGSWKVCMLCKGDSKYVLARSCTVHLKLQFNKDKATSISPHFHLNFILQKNLAKATHAIQQIDTLLICVGAIFAHTDASRVPHVESFPRPAP